MTRGLYLKLLNTENYNNQPTRKYLNAMDAGKMKPIQTAAVAPVNWNASQMLGIKFAPRKIIPISATVINANLRLSNTRGLADGKRSPSRFSRRAKKMIGKTSIR